MSKLIEIRLTKQLLFLTEQEIQRLLANEPEIWKTAIRRGKAEKRKRIEAQRKERENEQFKK